MNKPEKPEPPPTAPGPGLKWVTPEEYREAWLDDFELEVDKVTLWAADFKYPSASPERVQNELRPLVRQKMWDAMPAATRQFLMPMSEGIS